MSGKKSTFLPNYLEEIDKINDEAPSSNEIKRIKKKTNEPMFTISAHNSKKDTHTQKSFLIDNDLIEQLTKLKRETGIAMGKIVNDALAFYLDNLKVNKTKEK